MRCSPMPKTMPEDVIDAHLRILAEQAEDRLERVHTAEELAHQLARAKQIAGAQRDNRIFR